MKKKNFRKCKKLSTLVTLLTFVALHSGRIACCSDHMLFYIHKKHFLIATNDHFPYVWVWCDTEIYASFCATSHNLFSSTHHLTDAIRESVLGWSKNKSILSRSKFGRTPKCHNDTMTHTGGGRHSRHLIRNVSNKSHNICANEILSSFSHIQSFTRPINMPREIQHHVSSTTLKK